MTEGLSREQLEEQLQTTRNKLDALQNRYDELTAQSDQYNQMIAELQRFKKQLISLDDVVTDVLYRLDDKGCITYISDAIRRYGYYPDELIGKPILELVHPDDLAKAIYRVNERRTGDRKTMLLELRFKRKENVDVPLDAVSRWMEILPTFLVSAEGIYATESPQSQTFIGTVGYAKDITEKKIASIELYQAMDHLRAVLDAVPGYVSWVSCDLRYLGVNRYLAESFQKDPEYFIGKEVGFQKTDQPFAEYTREFMSGNLENDSREIMIHPAATPRWYLIVAQKYLQSRAAVFVGIEITRRKEAEAELETYRENLEELVAERTSQLQTTNDRLEHEISERKRAENELLRVQKLESIGILAGGIAHDFNNHLTAILGNVSVAKRYCESNEKLERLLDQMETATHMARELTQQLLTFSKGGAPIRKPVNLTGILHETAALSSHGSSVRCAFDIPEDLWHVSADKDQISQVVNNLLINAMQAMPLGGIIHVSARNLYVSPNELISLAAGNYVRFSIQDHGIGIPPEHISRVFDPYFSTKQTGSGLGLATAYSIITRHGGHITLESSLGTGTVFHVYLPAESAPGKQEEPLAHSEPRPHRHILVLEDETIVQNVIELMLAELNVHGVLASNGEDAFEMFRNAREQNQPFDLVILDLTIPGGMGGAETLRKIRELDPDVPAIVSSGYSNDPILAHHREHGFDGILSKPFTIEELDKALQNIRKNPPV